MMGGEYNISNFNMFVPSRDGAVYVGDVSVKNINVTAAKCGYWKGGIALPAKRYAQSCRMQ